KLCHTLGGSFNLPHAPTHAILLFYSVVYNATAAADQLQPLESLFGSDVGVGLYDFAKQINAPLALKAIGFNESQLDRASEIAVQNPYYNPQPIEQSAIRQMLQRALDGLPPQ